MDTLAFFQAVLPDDGIHYLVLFPKGKDYKVHKPYSDLESMAYAAMEFDADSSIDAVYHSCGAFRTPFIELEELNAWGKPKRKYRVPENWHRAKSFWCDLDCGQEKADKGAGYLTKTDAVKALYGFCAKVGWPRPMIVDSGGGLHAYWPLERSITHEKWRIVATQLKACMQHVGLIADPTRTADFASILRPPGSHNRKGGGQRPVRLRTEGTPSDPKELASALAKYVAAHDVKVQRAAPTKPASDLNSDLTGHLEYPDIPAHGDAVADKCQQMALLRASKGDVTYEHWRAAIGVLKHCVDGEQLAEEWSSERGNTGHSQTDWRTRFDTWSAGPSLCETFDKPECNPGGCSGCEFKGKVKTPLVLGRVIPINTEQAVTVETEEGQQQVVAPALPQGYVYSGGLLTRLIPDKDNVLQAFPFCTQHFYPTTRIRAEDGTYRIGMRVHLANHRVRDFDMPYEAMASSTDMLRCLAKYELTQSNHKDAGSHMAAYLRDQLEALKRRVDEVNTLTTFGWKGESFLMGDKLYMPDGTVKPVLLGGTASKYVTNFKGPQGTLAGYARAINRMYNHPGAQHWQYALCSGWGTVLTPLGEEVYKGLMVALRGGDSGKGKTTCCYASLYAFGNAMGMTLSSKDGFTYNALWAVLGTFNNLPLLLDELTNMEPAAFSNMAYNISLGQERVRMKSQGGAVSLAASSMWATSPFVTGNRDFHGLLASHQANSQAEAVRLIQIDVDSYPMVKLDEDPSRALALARLSVEEMRDNAGCAGDALLRYVVANRAAVQLEVRATLEKLATQITDPKFRFYINHGACTLTAARIAKQLGIADFDLDALYEFTVSLLTGLTEAVAATNTVTAEDAFSRMMAELASRIIVTHEYRDARHKNGPETPRNRVQGTVAGRYVLGTPTARDHAGWIILNQTEIRRWCMDNRVDYGAVLDQLERSGALIKRNDKFTLTRGTDIPTVQARCIVVNALRLDRDQLTLVSTTDSIGSDKDAAVAV